MVLQRGWRFLVRLAASDQDSTEERRRKELWIPIQGAGLAMVVVFELVFLENAYNLPLQAATLSCHSFVICFSVGLVYPIVTRRLSLRFIGTVILMEALAALLCDLTFAAEKDAFRPWTMVVLLMDLCLAFGVELRYQHASLHCTALWVIVTTFEDGFRLGVYDLDGLAPATGQAVLRLCDCTRPPCAAGLSYVPLVAMPLLVLYYDYVATRGFADGLRSEQTKVLASVITAEQVAEKLANFDLAAAEAALSQAEGELPERLATSFSRLLHNLGRYRPYLPQSCFEEGDEEPSARSSGTSDIPTATQVSMDSREAVDVLAASCASTASAEPGISRGRSHHPPQHRRVTVLMRNTSGFLAAAQEQSGAVQLWMAEEIQRFTTAVNQQGGVCDLLSGDHFAATFGAVKVQGSQCTAATKVAKLTTPPSAASSVGSRFSALQSSAAVCSGKALCGDFGSSLAQRFMVIGGVSSFVVAVERAVSAWRMGVLVDAAVHSDVAQLWGCRLRKLAVFPKVGRKPIALWEVLDERMAAGAHDEWMYELEAADSNPWDKYNDAVLLWCTAASHTQALDVVETGMGEAAPGGAVAEALVALLQSIQDGGRPPLGDFTAATFAGDPSPLQPQCPASGEQQPLTIASMSV